MVGLAAVEWSEVRMIWQVESTLDVGCGMWDVGVSVPRSDVEKSGVDVELMSTHLSQLSCDHV